jgi:hypothetical protein
MNDIKSKKLIFIKMTYVAITKVKILTLLVEMTVGSSLAYAQAVPLDSAWKYFVSVVKLMRIVTLQARRCLKFKFRVGFVQIYWMVKNHRPGYKH